MVHSILNPPLPPVDKVDQNSPLRKRYHSADTAPPPADITNFSSPFQKKSKVFPPSKIFPRSRNANKGTPSEMTFGIPTENLVSRGMWIYNGMDPWYTELIVKISRKNVRSL